MTPVALAVIVCTNRPASYLEATLQCIARQTERDRLEVVVVDDGSPTDLNALCSSAGVRLIRHDRNRGLAAARNTGLAHTSAELVAYTDDDCLPDPGWAAALRMAFSDPKVIAAGGPVRPLREDTLLQRYYADNNPLAPLEIDLAESSSVIYRFARYLVRNTSTGRETGRRPVYTLPGASFSFRRSTLQAVGGFDSKISFGGEDEDLFWRIREFIPEGTILYIPEATMAHDFDPSLRDALRRARSYGRGNARNCAKHDEWSPTVIPAPLLVGLLLPLAIRYRRLAILAFLVPLLSAPRWSILAMKRRSADCLIFAYLQFAQETAADAGFLPAWRHYRMSLTRSGPFSL